jgi:putative transposase
MEGQRFFRNPKAAEALRHHRRTQLIELSGFADVRDYQTAHRQWVEQGLESGLWMGDDRWTESIAVGSLTFIDQVKNELGFKADHRDVIESDGSYVLRQAAEGYALDFTVEMRLWFQNTLFGMKSLMKQRYSLVRPEI